jgi:hypothetical protein
LAEFCDDVIYHCERMKSLRVYLEAENIVTQHARGGHANSAVADGIRSLRKDSIGEHFPLSRGPHHADGLLGLDWYVMRAKVGAAYLAAVTSAIGESDGRPTQSIPRSLQLMKSMISAL